MEITIFCEIKMTIISLIEIKLYFENSIKIPEGLRNPLLKMVKSRENFKMTVLSLSPQVTSGSRVILWREMTGETWFNESVIKSK